MMYVGNKLPITPSCPAADYVPSSSTQLRRQTGNTVSTVAISPPASRHHNHRSRRRSRRVRSLRVRRRNIALSSDKDQREVAEKGSHEAADVKEGVAPPWWRTENWKRGYNCYAALSSTEEDAGFESQEYGSAGYGVDIIGVGGELALRRLRKRGILYEGFGRIILLEQGSGINHCPGDAPAGFSTEMRQDRQYADADAAGSDRRKKMLLPRLTDLTFSVPSLLTEITKKPTRGMAAMRTRMIAEAATVEAAQEAATSLLDPPTISYYNRCIVGDGNKAVAFSPPSSNAAFASHSTHVLFRGEESAEPRLSSSSLAGDEDLSRRYLLNKANNPSQTSSASSMAMLSSRPAAVPSPPAQEVPLRPCIPLSSNPTPMLATGQASVTTPRPCYNPILLPKFIPSAAARKVATNGRRTPICLLQARSIDTTDSPLFSIDDPAKAREKRKGEERASGSRHGLSMSTLKRKDARGLMKKKTMMMVERRGSWLVEELIRMWKERVDGSSPSPSSASSSILAAHTTLTRSERKRPGMLNKSQVFSTIISGGYDFDGWEDDAKVVDAGWLEYIMISAPIDFGQGQGGMSKGNERVEVPIITSAVVGLGLGLARFEEDEDEGVKRVGGNDILEADGDGKEKGEEGEEGLLVELYENIGGGKQEGGGRGLGNELEFLVSEMEMGESWGWDVISRVEAYD